MHTVQLQYSCQWCYTQYSVYVLLFLLDPNYSWELKSPTWVTCRVRLCRVAYSTASCEDLYRSGWPVLGPAHCWCCVRWCAKAAQWSLRCAHRPA